MLCFMIKLIKSSFFDEVETIEEVVEEVSIVNKNVASSVKAFASVTRAVNVNIPVSIGVPFIIPVVFNANPFPKLPVIKLHVYGALPLFTDKFA